MKTLHKNLFKQPFFWTSICSCLALGILVALYSHAWVAPGAAPNLNTNAAINFSGGNVGIGTASPGAALEVIGSGSTSGFASKISHNVNTAGYNGLQLSIWDGSVNTSAFEILQQSNILLKIRGDGNVGIGTTAPDAALTIKTSGSNAALNMYGVIASTDYSVLQVSSTGGLTNPSSRALNIQPNGGNVGIGPCENLPSEKLEVMGNIKISGTGNGIKFPDATVQTTAAVAGGTMSWPTSVKETTATHNGAFATSPANGYAAIETWIQSNGCSTYHVCMPWELTYAFGHLANADLCGDGTCTGMLNAGISDGTPMNDCAGWTSVGSNIRVPYWLDRAPALTNYCNSVYTVLCCK